MGGDRSHRIYYKLLIGQLTVAGVQILEGADNGKLNQRHGNVPHDIDDNSYAWNIAGTECIIKWHPDNAVPTMLQNNPTTGPFTNTQVRAIKQEPGWI